MVVVIYLYLILFVHTLPLFSNPNPSCYQFKTHTHKKNLKELTASVLKKDQKHTRGLMPSSFC